MEAPVDSLAFSEDQVSALTGLSKRQLRYWDSEKKFFSPEYMIAGRRVYSFRDLVGLRTIAPIRKRVSLQQLRKIDEELHKHHETPWASLKFYLFGKELLYRIPEGGEIVSASKPGQRPLFETISLEAVRSTTIRDLPKFQERSASELGKVQRRKNVMHGSAVIAGTRIPTALIWRYVQAGFSPEKIVSGFPRLTVIDVKRAISYERKQRARRKLAS
jgi:uncharacterized protein (DUF433 family)